MAGEYRGGLIPFGFDAVNMGRVNKKGKPVKDLVRNEEEAAIKAQVYHMIVDEGYGGNRIANWLNERGIKTKRGTTLWRATSVRAMIGNPIDRGQMHMGETLSEPMDELRIIDDYYYYKAIEIIEERGRENAARRRSPLRTNAGGLLSGLIYCGECGQRLTINHTHKVKTTSTGTHDYERDVYRCFRKMNARVTCTGQSTYNAERIEETALGVVRSFFARISRVPEATQVKAAMRREESTQAKALADAAAAVDKATKAVAALEDQAIKALTGESQLDLATAANIEKANINWADIGELAAQIATIAQAQITTANIVQANIDWASIANLNAEIAKIAKAQITAANIESAAIDWAAIKDLNAAVAKIALAQLTTANINNAEIDWASISQLQADIATLVNASIKTADIDWAQIKDLTAGTAIIEKGVNGKLYVADLAVTEANMACLTVGELIVKGADGCFYALSIAENGTVTTEKKSVGDADIGDNSISGGKLIEKTITARELNVASIFADEALVGAITAANIDVSSLFAAEAFIAQLNAVDISGNESLRLVVDAAKDEALDATGEAVAQIALTAEQIRSEVKRDYATADQVSQMNETLSTLAEQSENNFTWTVTKVNEIIEDAAANDNLTREQLNLIHTYMRFGEDGLTIGKAGNPLTFRVVNDRLAFYMNDTEVAYLSDNKLYVTQAEILARLQIGKFAYEPQSNGNLSVIYTG